MNILVIAPHPDDEILGCGGMLVKKAHEGNTIYRCIVTSAYQPDWTENFIKKREKEIKNSGTFLNFKDTFLLNFPTVKLSSVPQNELNKALEEVIRKIKPSVVLIPFYGDLNKDHRMVYEACLVVSRPKNNSITQILMYETVSETEWGGYSDIFEPTVYVDITKVFQKKIQALRMYKSELRVFPHPRSLKGVTYLARKRGSEAGILYAEAFMLVRELL